MKHLVMNRLAATEIRRVRQLPFRGEVLVTMGQSLHPEDLIAEAALPAEIYTLDIARGLGIDPSEVVSCLVRDLGEELAQDDVLAECERTLARLVRVPQAGQLLACRDGVAFIAAGKRKVSVQAGMIGVVSDILPERGAILTTQGSLIQGVWGNGQVGAGVLRTQTAVLKKVTSPETLMEIDAGQVIALGGCSHQDLLGKILEKKPTGLILGSLSPDLMSLVAAQHFPVILLGGFGELPPDEHTFQLLHEKSGQVVCLNASKPDYIDGVLPEIIIPSSQGDPQSVWPFQAEIKIGQRVQVMSGAERGGVYTVVGLPEEMASLESGLISKVSVLKPDEGEEMMAPIENLAILGV